MFDVIIAVIAAIAQSLTVYWGWRLIAQPLAPEDANRKHRFEFGFIACGLTGVLAIGIAAYRGSSIGAELAEITKNTKTPPTVNVNVPPPTVIQQTSGTTDTLGAVANRKESPTSLRRRTLKLADELQRFLVERYENPKRPPVATPDSRDPNPSDERKQAIKLYIDYEQATIDMYMRMYKDRMVGIIKEYESKGVPTSYLESDVKQRPPYLAIGTAAEGSPNDELFMFRNLAYRVDAYDNAIYVPY